MNDLAIEIRGLQKSFERFQLGPLDLRVPRGAIYGLIGPNGAGKTTTVDLIMGMGREDAGAINVFGLDHWKCEAEIKRQIGYVSPDLSYDSWRKVWRAIHFVRSYYPGWDTQYCDDLLGKLGITWDDKIPTLSLGARAKLALVIALSHRPALLLLDEPTLGLDAISKREIFAQLLSAVQDEARTVLIASNTLSDIERFADHVGIIHNGRLLLEGNTADVLDRFRLVDCTLAEAIRPPAIKGLFVQEHSDNRFRALVDVHGEAMGWLREKGATNVTATPVTLEDLFVELVKEG